MKNIFLISSFLFLIYSCKIDDDKQSHCIELITDTVSNHMIYGSDLIIAKGLLTNNKLNINALKIIYYSEFDTPKVIVCRQFIDGYPVLNDYVIFRFNSDSKITDTSGYVLPDSLKFYKNLSSNNRLLSIEEASDTFVELINKDNFISNKSKYLSQCFIAEKGFYNMNDSNDEYIGVWRIKTKIKDYPLVYIPIITGQSYTHMYFTSIVNK